MYVNDPQPLDEGEEKHVISAFVADESGMINRVAGVFARRGGLAFSYACTYSYVWSSLHNVDDMHPSLSPLPRHAGANIESLAVGLNIDKALFTIAITGRASTVVNALSIPCMSSIQ